MKLRKPSSVQIKARKMYEDVLKPRFLEKKLFSDGDVDERFESKDTEALNKDLPSGAEMSKTFYGFINSLKKLSDCGIKEIIKKKKNDLE